MIPMLLEAIALPSALGICLLLCPRDGWSVEAQERRPSWTAALAVAITVIVSLWMSEGLQLFDLEERWNWLVVCATIAGIGGVIGASELPSGRVDIITLCATPILALFVLTMPAHESMAQRLGAGIAVAVGAALLIEPSRHAARWTGFVFALACTAMAAILASSGSMKVALAATALALLCATFGILAQLCRAFCPGPGFAMATLSMLAAFAFYGMSYHDDTGIPAGAWWFVAFAPLVLVASPTLKARRSSRRPTGSLETKS
ncbi:MAG: hypothetical protein EXS03_07790 [Phycisphaerales bacterium]|nr:hypothetical protein [Phycisphaerales bacterium]